MSGKFRKALDLLLLPTSSRKFSMRIRRAAAAKTVPTLALTTRLLIAGAFVLGQPVFAEPTPDLPVRASSDVFSALQAFVQTQQVVSINLAASPSGETAQGQGQGRAATRPVRRAARLRPGRRRVGSRAAAGAGGRARRCDSCRDARRRRLARRRLFRAEGLRPRRRRLGLAPGFGAGRRRSCAAARLLDVSRVRSGRRHSRGAARLDDDCRCVRVVASRASRRDPHCRRIEAIRQGRLLDAGGLRRGQGRGEADRARRRILRGDEG